MNGGLCYSQTSNRGFLKSEFSNPKTCTVQYTRLSILFQCTQWSCVLTYASDLRVSSFLNVHDDVDSRFAVEPSSRSYRTHQSFPALTSTTTTMEPSSPMKELHKMVAASAIYDGERDEKDDYTGVCHPGTREEHLENLKAWASSTPPETRVEWFNAIAGAGKTATLRTFCTELEERNGLPSISFFVWKGDSKRNTLQFFPATIAAQLCRRIPALVFYIEKAINEDSFLLQSAFRKQMEQLVIRPLLNCCDTIKGERHLIIVVDGLDELDASGQAELLDFIPYLLRRLSSLPISLLVSSRPDPQIVGAFNHPKLASITRATRLGASDEDIRKFLDDKFDDINLRHPYLQIEHGGKWPSQEKREIMVRQSSGLFIWPTVAIGHIDKVEKGLGHNARLDQVLSSAEPKPWIASPLDNLYRAILEAHAPEDRTSFEFFRFKRRLALLCIIDFARFVYVIRGQAINWSDIPVHVIFEETLDELWTSVAGLSSLFLPRKPLSHHESPTPGISHRSLRDFAFNKARCGEELYYSSEQELHAEIACKIIKFFNTRQAYQTSAETSAWFLYTVGKLQKSHLEKAAVSEELGRCMDDITLDYIPPSWPLVAQIFPTVKLFGDLYKVAESPDFPEGSRRREALLSKVMAFIKTRTANAQELDTAVFRLAISTAKFRHDAYSSSSYHSVDCWHISRTPQCTCLDAYMRHIPLDYYQKVHADSTLFQDARSRLVENTDGSVAKDSLYVLQFFLSLSKTSQRAAGLSPFISVRSDDWIIDLLQHCPPNDDLYNTLGPICTAPLPDLPQREGGDSWALVDQFLDQTKAFNEYAERCRKVGIETKFPSIKIPDDWWQDRKSRDILLKFRYQPPFDIPDEWWQDEKTRMGLLDQGYKPPFQIPDEWWQQKWARVGLLDQGFEPPFDIPICWWQDEDTRRLLRRRGYPPPDPYSAEGTPSKGEGVESTTQEVNTDQSLSQQAEPLVGGETLSTVASPAVSPPPPTVASSNPLHIQFDAPAHPTMTPLENASRQRRGFRDSLKNLFRR